jgi:hypothetical protein
VALAGRGEKRLSPPPGPHFQWGIAKGKAMKKSQSKRADRPLFILFANTDPSQFEATMLQQVDVSKSESMIERIRDDLSKVPVACMKLKKILNQIIAKGKLVESEELTYFLRVANERQIEYRIENGKLIEDSKIGIHWVLYPLWLRGLSMDVVKFLSSGKNLQRIRRCDWCDRYFIASKADERIKYCSICSPKDKKSTAQKSAAQKRWRAKEKAKVIQSEDVEQIARMLLAGYKTREEAEADWQEAKEEDKEG